MILNLNQSTRVAITAKNPSKSWLMSCPDGVRPHLSHLSHIAGTGHSQAQNLGTTKGILSFFSPFTRKCGKNMNNQLERWKNDDNQLEFGDYIDYSIFREWKNGWWSTGIGSGKPTSAEIIQPIIVVAFPERSTHKLKPQHPASYSRQIFTNTCSERVISILRFNM